MIKSKLQNVVKLRKIETKGQIQLQSLGQYNMQLDTDATVDQPGESNTFDRKKSSLDN